MEIRDPVHGSVCIPDKIVPVIRSVFFQRLRNIKQLGLSELIFPGATHSRLLHSIGVMHIGNRCFKKLFVDVLPKQHYRRLKNTLNLACLLHDIGHAPLSHSTESVMPMLAELDIPKGFCRSGENLQATHEDYTLKAILDSSLTASLQAVEHSHEVDKGRIAELITGETSAPDYFCVDGINYFPLLHQLVSSELDCDRMDYLLRDSYFCGVSYGHYDLDWLIDNLEIVVEGDEASLGITERSIITFDDFLLSRYHMFIMVYFHYRAVCLEKLLYRYFQTAPEEYAIPADIERYVEYDDYHLKKVIKSSKNKYARAISLNRIPPKIYESFNEQQLQQLNTIQDFLASENIEYIRCSSQGQLSKYHGQTSRPIKVSRKFYNIPKRTYVDISQATDLFDKFEKTHEVNRLHCYPNDLSPQGQKKLAQLIRQ